MINEELYNLIREYTHIAIAAHISPDGDALGACTAFALALEKLGKKPIILINDYPEKYDFLSFKSFVYKEYPSHLPLELFIALDCGDKERLGNYTKNYDKAKFTINIDHHITNPKYGDYNMVDTDASSTCEIIYKLIKTWDIPLDNEIASSLYTGIAFDTGGFKHNNTTSFTHQVISNLMHHDINFTSIMNKLFYSRSLQATQLLGYSLNKIELFQNNQFCLCSLDKDEIKQSGANDSDTEGIIAFMKNIEGVLIALLLYEKAKNEIKVSFRSSENIDVCSIAQKFGGGGHKKAAGCTLYKSMKDAKKEMIYSILKELF